MRHQLVQLLEKKTIKIALILYCVVVTLVFGPMAIFGIYVFGLYLASQVLIPAQTNDLQTMAAIGLLGAGGLVGLVGAWVSILLPSVQIQASRWLRRYLLASLSIGVVTAAYLTRNFGPNNQFILWLSLVSGVIGLALLGAILAASKNTRN